MKMSKLAKQLNTSESTISEEIKNKLIKIQENKINKLKSMKDRISQFSGRVQLIPVEGQPNIYDLIRADQSSEPGTPIKKSTLLSDTTAGKIWPLIQSEHSAMIG